jgi:hypothetical protein
MAGYTEIQIGGQKIGLQFSVSALQLIYEKFPDCGTKLEAELLMQIQKNAYILYCAYRTNCVANFQVVEIGFKEFFLYVEDLDNRAELMIAMEIYNQSLITKLKDTVEDEKKKRRSLNGKKSNPSVSEKGKTITV